MKVHNPGRMDFYGQYNNKRQHRAPPRLLGLLLPQTMPQSDDTRASLPPEHTPAGTALSNPRCPALRAPTG